MSTSTLRRMSRPAAARTSAYEKRRSGRPPDTRPSRREPDQDGRRARGVAMQGARRERGSLHTRGRLGGRPRRGWRRSRSRRRSRPAHTRRPRPTSPRRAGGSQPRRSAGRRARGRTPRPGPRGAPPSRVRTDGCGRLGGRRRRRRRVRSAATRSVPECAASEKSPRLPVARPVTSLTAIRTAAATTETSAIRR